MSKQRAKLQRDRGFYNSQIPPAQLRVIAALDETGEKTLEMAMRRMNLSARSHDRLLRVARTIADLDHAPNVAAKHIAEAVQFRNLDRNYWGLKMSTAQVSLALVESRILVVRGEKVLVDFDLAALYHVTTGNLNKAVKRNRKRFPDDFMFQLSQEETDSLIFQNGRSKKGPRGGRRYCPYAFNEQGVSMLSSVLTSEHAIDVNISIMRTFVNLRRLLATHAELARRLEQLEWRQNEQDGRVQYVFDVIQQMIDAQESEPLLKSKRGIGFPTSQSVRSAT